MEAHYRSLVEFEKTAKEDRAFLKKVRAELSEENRKLEAMLDGKGDGSSGEVQET